MYAATRWHVVNVGPSPLICQRLYFCGKFNMTIQMQAATAQMQATISGNHGIFFCLSSGM